MTRKIAFMASLAAILATAACADATGPKKDCIILNGGMTCTPD
jgi:hypothetical protein